MKRRTSKEAEKIIAVAPEEIRAHLQRGKADFEAGRYTEALKEFEAILKTAPGNIETRIWIRKVKEELAKSKIEVVNEKGGGKAMRIGSVVEIKKYDAMPGVVGEYAEIVRLQIQEFEKYAVYPVWAKILFGEQKGKIYGFRYDEVAEPTLGFWEGKTPCWELHRCPEMIRNECPAFKYRSKPCWKIEGTYCKLNDYGATGLDTSICEVCRVYKKYGHGEPLPTHLFFGH